MECLSHKTEIESTFSWVRNISYAEKKNPLIDEEATNKLLDAILDFKNSLSEKTDSIYEVNERMEKLTWFNDLNDECLMLINDLIAVAKDLHSSLIRQYVRMNTVLKSNGIATNEINEYKNSIDELKEAYTDLESVFFFLPEMPQFVDTTRELSLV